jgi:5-methylcytosine-specific restriction endonuclease McrA
MVVRAQPIPERVRREIKSRSGGLCEAQLATVCAYYGSDIHHRKSRARGGSNHPSNLLNVCRPCHSAIEAHKIGTGRFRTHSFQEEGVGEDGRSWQPQDQRKR